ncbi:MAG TPA: serine O-acetyltransferase, partial [Desulfuromonadales bacterium]|nr:serine O-acetyltransferase [Desulfuromonadales bacterium]
VTLGGTSWAKEKRHPTLGDNVIVGSGAKILGPFTVGDNAKVGSNSVVVKEVPPNATVVGIPGRVVLSEAERQERVDLEHGRLPDPEAKAISCLFDQIRALERKVHELTEEQERLRDQLARSSAELPETVAEEA